MELTGQEPCDRNRANDGFILGEALLKVFPVCLPPWAVEGIRHGPSACWLHHDPLEALPPAQGAIHNGSLGSVLSFPSGEMQIHYIQPRRDCSKSEFGRDDVAGTMEWTASWILTGPAPVVDPFVRGGTRCWSFNRCRKSGAPVDGSAMTIPATQRLPLKHRARWRLPAFSGQACGGTLGSRCFCRQAFSAAPRTASSRARHLRGILTVYDTARGYRAAINSVLWAPPELVAACSP